MRIICKSVGHTHKHLLIIPTHYWMKIIPLFAYCYTANGQTVETPEKLEKWPLFGFNWYIVLNNVFKSLESTIKIERKKFLLFCFLTLNSVAFEGIIENNKSISVSSATHKRHPIHDTIRLTHIIHDITSLNTSRLDILNLDTQHLQRVYIYLVC